MAIEVRAAALHCQSLRDDLWHLVDAKVAAAIAIDDRTLAQRPAWLAAAAAVTTGAADATGADELVRHHIKPYVDNDIRVDWLTAMRSTLTQAAASYDTVTDRLASAPRADFEIPGDLCFDRESPDVPLPAEPTTGVVTAPAAVLPTQRSDGVSPATPAPPDSGPAFAADSAIPDRCRQRERALAMLAASMLSADLRGLPAGSSQRWEACWVRRLASSPIR